jgi:very-short-patch-repair endonuclease
MKAERALQRMGGTATWGQLRRATHWRWIKGALDEGTIVRTGRGHYALATEQASKAAAHRLSGYASHTSAALHWGWKVKLVPEQPHVTVRAKRSLPAGAAAGVMLHWRDLLSDEVEGWVTTRARTVVDCCLDLPFDEALAVFDSALRAGVRKAEVLELAAWLGGRRLRRVQRVAAAATSQAANPFESVLRAIALGVPGLAVTAQHRICDDGFFAKVDLADAELRIVIEAESFEFHGERKQLVRDCRRYTELAARGWVVLRFTWDQVMFQAAYVRQMIELTVAVRRGQLAGATAVPVAG